MVELMVSMGFMLFMFIFYYNKLLKLFNQSLTFLFSFIFLFSVQSEFCWSITSQYIFCGVDQYNYILMIFLFWLMGLTSLSLSNESSKLSLFMLYCLMFFIFMTFSTMNFLVFYFFFEASLLPIFFIIVGLGSNYKRFFASMYMLMYTLFFSLPLLLVMMNCFNKFNSLMIIYLTYESMEVDLIYYIFFIMAFLVKMPMYSLHVWLPKAHVEAPCCGSMVLAGILLKLGSYGLLRSMMMMIASAMKFNVIFISYVLVGSLISSIMCLYQSDLKMLIAYSSVVHMGMMLGGMMTMSLMGYLGSLYMMVGHGLCSSGLFFIVNINYERIGSRLIYMNKGLINIVPSLSLWWFLLSSSNMAAPISLNLISEILLMSSLILFDNLMILLLVFISLLSACYSIYLFSSSQHGNLNLLLVKFSPGNMTEYLSMILHWVPLNFLMINMNLIYYLMY